jgi:predicted nucleotidyltransferase
MGFVQSAAPDVSTLASMTTPTPTTQRLRAALTAQGDRVAEVLDRYAAVNPRLFGSVARGDAGEGSDLDLLVDLLPTGGNELMRVAGLCEELSELLGVRVDVVAPTLLREAVSATALADAVAV